MNSYRQILYHVVFCTYKRKPSLPEDQHEKLYKFISGILKRRKCTLYQINGTENHIHVLSDLHPTLCLADYIKEIKTASTLWMKKNGNFPDFEHWANGYFAGTYHIQEKNKVLNYIKLQKEKHKMINLEKEYKKLLDEHGINWDERYIF